MASADGMMFASFRDKKAPERRNFRDLDSILSDLTTIDLSLSPQHTLAEQNKLFPEAVKLLDSIKQDPSCNQRAVTNLLASCQELPSKESETGPYSASDLDHVKSLYAARLALCEISSAGANIPPHCSNVLPSNNNSRRIPKFRSRASQNTHNGDVIPGKLLAPCLKALESKPQWWTSYSNNRQNAAVMCHAARFEIEKEELLNQHRVLTEVTSELNWQLNRSLEATDAEARRQKEVILIVDNLRLKLLHDLRKDKAAIQNQLYELLNGARDSFRDTNGELQAFVTSALADVAVLSKQIQHSASSIREIKEALGSVLREEVKQKSELIAAEQVSLRSNSHLILDIQRSLQEIKDNRVGFIVKELADVHTSMRSLNGIVLSVNEKHSSLDDRLKHFDAAFYSFEQKAANLQDIMAVQIKNQTRFQNLIYRNLHVTQTLLHNITESAACLQSTISDAQSKLITYNALIPRPITFMWLVLIVASYSLVLFKVKTIVLIFFACAYLFALTYFVGLFYNAADKRYPNLFRTMSLTESLFVFLASGIGGWVTTKLAMRGYDPLSLRGTIAGAVSKPQISALP